MKMTEQEAAHWRTCQVEAMKAIITNQAMLLVVDKNFDGPTQKCLPDYASGLADEMLKQAKTHGAISEPSTPYTYPG